MPRTFETRFPVRSYELDALGHVNHAVFLNYFEQSRVDALAHAGYSWHELLERGWLFNVVHVEVDFRGDARVGDVVHVSTSAASFGNTSMTVAHRAWKNDDPDAVVAEARVVGVLLDHAGKPTRIPDELREVLG